MDYQIIKSTLGLSHSIRFPPGRLGLKCPHCGNSRLQSHGLSDNKKHTGATRHHLNKATMKDLKLEQTKPVGRIWTDDPPFPIRHSNNHLSTIGLWLTNRSGNPITFEPDAFTAAHRDSLTVSSIILLMLLSE
jgi:hypothetical protein